MPTAYGYQAEPERERESETSYSADAEFEYEEESESKQASSYRNSQDEERLVRSGTDYVQRANSVASLMLAAATETDLMPSFSPKAEGAPLADVESDVYQFSAQYRYCEENEFRFPCFYSPTWPSDRPPIPMDLTPIVGPLWDVQTTLPPAFAQQSFAFLNEQGPLFAESAKLAYQDFNPSEVRQFFGHRLARFLVSRFRGETRSTGRFYLLRNALRSAFRGEPPRTFAPYGIPFKVFTNTDGLRVHYSPAYWYTPNRVFGSPTSPVEQEIRPGRYMFGAAGPNFKLQFDPGEFDIPPMEKAELDL